MSMGLNHQLLPAQLLLKSWCWAFVCWRLCWLFLCLKSGCFQCGSSCLHAGQMQHLGNVLSTKHLLCLLPMAAHPQQFVPNALPNLVAFSNHLQRETGLQCTRMALQVINLAYSFWIKIKHLSLLCGTPPPFVSKLIVILIYFKQTNDLLPECLLCWFPSIQLNTWTFLTFFWCALSCIIFPLLSQNNLKLIRNNHGPHLLRVCNLIVFTLVGGPLNELVHYIFFFVRDLQIKHMSHHCELFSIDHFVGYTNVTWIYFETQLLQILSQFPAKQQRWNHHCTQCLQNL